jgi:hypothetical protein
LIARPPRAAGRRCFERIEHPAARLPAHERQRRPSIRQVAWRAARRPVEHPRHQRKPRGGIVAYGRDLLLGPNECVRVIAHRREVLPYEGFRGFLVRVKKDSGPLSLPRECGS